MNNSGHLKTINIETVSTTLAVRVYILGGVSEPHDPGWLRVRSHADYRVYSGTNYRLCGGWNRRLKKTG